MHHLLHIQNIFWFLTLNYLEIINWHFSKHRVTYLLITFALSALQVITSDLHQTLHREFFLWLNNKLNPSNFKLIHHCEVSVEFVVCLGAFFHCKKPDPHLIPIASFFQLQIPISSLFPQKESPCSVTIIAHLSVTQKARMTFRSYTKHTHKHNFN